MALVLYSAELDSVPGIPAGHPSLPVLLEYRTGNDL